MTHEKSNLFTLLGYKQIIENENYFAHFTVCKKRFTKHGRYLIDKVKTDKYWLWSYYFDYRVKLDDNHP